MSNQRKRILAAILIFDVVTGLLLLFLLGNKLKGIAEYGGLGGKTVRTVSSVQIQNAKVENAEENPAAQEEEVRKIALTFDDGPHPYYTEQLLDGLKERGVVVTFFVTGEHAALHPDVIKRMHEEGHLIGNHTYSHMQLTNGNQEEFKEELIATSEVIEEIIDEEVIYVRPPYGTWDKSFETELNMIPVLWTIDPLDWCSDDVACVVDKVTKKVGENDIILMHDYYESTITAALKIVDDLKEEGYTFVTVEEILFD